MDRDRERELLKIIEARDREIAGLKVKKSQTILTVDGFAFAMGLRAFSKDRTAHRDERFVLLETGPIIDINSIIEIGKFIKKQRAHSWKRRACFDSRLKKQKRVYRGQSFCKKIIAPVRT